MNRVFVATMPGALHLSFGTGGSDPRELVEQVLENWFEDAEPDVVTAAGLIEFQSNDTPSPGQVRSFATAKKRNKAANAFVLVGKSYGGIKAILKVMKYRNDDGLFHRALRYGRVGLFIVDPFGSGYGRRMSGRPKRRGALISLPLALRSRMSGDGFRGQCFFQLNGWPIGAMVRYVPNVMFAGGGVDPWHGVCPPLPDTAVVSADVPDATDVLHTNILSHGALREFRKEVGGEELALGMDAMLRWAVGLSAPSSTSPLASQSNMA